jgi:pimeloyl-ACP methyl ester carboxylesterase
LNITKLDPAEEHFWVPYQGGGLALFLRYLPPINTKTNFGENRVVLYIQGATFPSALSIAHRFDGRSWRDELAAAGFHVWGLDFLGFGAADRYPEMADPPDGKPALGRAEEASKQIETAVQFIVARHGVERISIIAHSWGTIATGHFVSRYPKLVNRLVFFAPITCRNGQDKAPDASSWRLVTLKDQWNRFVEDVPAGETPVLSQRDFAAWGESYLDTDPASRTRNPPAVKIPNGPTQDIKGAWAGKLAYDPSAVQAPVTIIRGQWDSTCGDADTRWLFDALKHSPTKRLVTVSRGTHLLHLEENRYALYREAQIFLQGHELPINRDQPDKIRNLCLP